jgi:predicted  nucleic acid-binding Zn-ribbon protein
MKPGLGGRRCQRCGAKVEGAGSKLLRDCPSCGASLDGHQASPYQAKSTGSFIPWIVVALLCVVVGIGIAVFFQVRALQEAAPTLGTTADAGADASPRIFQGGGTKPFDRASATQQLTDAAETVDDCREQGGPPGGTVVTTILVQPNGKVSDVTFARAGFIDTSQGKCIADRFSKIRVPPFAGLPEKLSKSLALP